MDYKEKYEQAIERLKQWDREHPCAGYVLSDRDKFIFPELKENEDEKIKNRLIKLIKMSSEFGGLALHKWEADEMLAWLEKQGQQKSADSYCQENCKGFQETGKCFADGECKAKRKADSTNEVEPKFKVGDKIYLKPEYRMPDDDTPIANTVKEIRRIDDKHYRFDGSYIFIEDQDKYELVEQKPEENKGNIGGISANPEWGEDDEVFLDDILCKLEHDLILNKDEKDWLKSLKGRVQLQNKWKPSDVQIECLSDAIKHYNSLGYPASKLKELLDDLKKLNGGEI